ncbi:MAG: Dabb family protein [Pseudomonadota bacterium]
MIVHCVFCRFLPDAPPDDIVDVLESLARFAQGLSGVQSVEVGPNRDFEGKSEGFGHGFIIRFRDRAALEAYAVDPTHVALGGRLCALCVGGADGIMVFDLEVS